MRIPETVLRNEWREAEILFDYSNQVVGLQLVFIDIDVFYIICRTK